VLTFKEAVKEELKFKPSRSPFPKTTPLPEADHMKCNYFPWGLTISAKSEAKEKHFSM